MNYYNNILAQGAWLGLNTRLVHVLGINDAIVFTQLVDKYADYAASGSLNSDGFFYTTYDELHDDTMLSRKQIILSVNNLVARGLVKTDIDYIDGKKRKYYKPDTTKSDDLLRAAGEGSITINTIPEKAYITYNRAIAKVVGPPSAIILSDVLTTYKNVEVDGNLNEDGSCFYSQQTMAKRLGVSRQIIIRSYLPALVKEGFLILGGADWPRRATAIVNEDKIEEVLGREKVEREESYVVLLTKKILHKAVKLSGSKDGWGFNYGKVGYIEQRLAEGITEEDMLDMIEYKFNEYVVEDPKRVEEGKKSKIHLFNFKYLFYTKCQEHIDQMKEDRENNTALLEAEKVAATLYNTMIECSKGEARSIVLNKANIGLIRDRLDEGLTEEELIEHAISRYDFLIRADCSIKKYYTWSRLFGDECFDQVYRKRVAKNLESAKGTKNAKKSKSNTKANPNIDTPDGVETNALTQEEKENARIMADYYESIGEVGYF